MRSKGKKLLAGFLAVAMSLSVSLSALPALALGAGEGEPPLHLQDGWVVKKGDADSTGAAQGSTQLITVGGTEMSHLKAGPGNGNSPHFNSTNPAAFVLTESDYTNESFSVDVLMNSEMAATRFRLVTKYVDENNWSFVFFDGATGWAYQYKTPSTEAWPGIEGLPAWEKGQTVRMAGEWQDDGLHLTVTNLDTQASGSAVLNAAEFVSQKDMPGKIGLGAARYMEEYTDIYFSNLTVGGAAYEGALPFFKDGLEGQTYEESVLVGGETMRQVAAGSENGNTKGDKAYVSKPGVEGTLSGTMETTFTNATPEGTTPKYAAIFRYTDSSHWAAVGHDGSRWYYQVVGDEGNNSVTLGGVDAAPNGTVTVKVEYTADEVSAITINGQPASFTGAPAGFGTLPAGTIGYLLSQNTVLNVSALTFESTEAPEPTPEPTQSPNPGGKKWITVRGGGGGHNYADPSGSGPAALLDQDATMSPSGELSLEFRPVSENMNYGIFYYFKDNSNWLYIGYDPSSKWYYQYSLNGSGSYPGLGGLPAPVPGESMEVSISLSRETLSVTVNGTTVRSTNQQLIDLADAMGSDARYGVMTKGCEVEFANMKLNGEDCMEHNWQFACERGGQYTSERYSALVEVSGTVKDSETGEPIEGAVVRAGLGKTETEADGSFALQNVETGEYSLAVTKPGYQAYTEEITVVDEDITGLEIDLAKKAPINLDDYDYIESDTMRVYIGKNFSVVAQYQLKQGDGPDSWPIFRGQEQQIDVVTINGVDIVPEVSVEESFENGAAYKNYVMALKNEPAAEGDPVIDLTMTVKVSVSGEDLTWEVTDLVKNEGCDDIATIDVPNLNLITVDAVEEGANFAGAKASTTTTSIADAYINFDEGFIPSETDSYLYGILVNDKLSAGIFSNSEIEGDLRIVRNNGADTMSLTSALWYYERGDKGGQQRTELTYRVSELPWVKVAIGGDLNEDGQIDWNDGALASRRVVYVPEGSEVIKDTVNYRIVMNFASMAPNPYLETADNIKKVYLATDGLPQAVMLKGYGNEGHDSANSEYADIAVREGGVEDFQDLIKIAHDYNTEIGIHINAQEAYPESKSFCEEMIGWPSVGNGWGWLDQSHTIDKLWDLGTQARWMRMVQLYDRINNTNFLSQRVWPEAVGNTEGITDIPTLEELRADAATREDNMDFIYLDVWYQNSWETRRVAEEINSLGWRFTTEFSAQGEYNSTWQHWSTDATYGGASSKGLNSDIIRFIRNDQRDSQVLNWPSFGGTSDNPLLGGFWLAGFEGWETGLDYNQYIYRTFNTNLPTRFLQHYYVTKWENYAEGESPVGNHEKQITLKNDDGDVVVVTRNEAQRSDEEIERVITLNGKTVLNTDTEMSAYLLPWTDNQTGDEKLYHWNMDGGTTTWELQDEWAGLSSVTMYELSDQGRINPQTVNVANGVVTLEAKAATAYVLVSEAGLKELKNDFGEANYVVDPGFNGYASGEQLDKADWSGDIDNAAISVQKPVTGDQRLVFDSPAEDVGITTKISGLEAGERYVAQIYVDNLSDYKASISVNTGKETVSSYTYRSIAGNYVKCDEEHTRDSLPSNMQIMLVPFTAEKSTALLTLSREAGSGLTYMDDIRVVKIDLNNYQEDGTFVQDFETVVQGLYPFVLGPAQGVTDPVTHLSQLHAPYTQAGWNGRVLDDVIEGEWSLKHHGKNGGIIYQTIPQNFRFEPGKAYNVTFDYQAGPNKAYAMVIGDGGEYYVPTEEQYLPTTRTGSENEGTQTVTMQVVGSLSGQTWIGLYSNSGRFDVSGAMGQSDFILDNLVIEEDKEAFILKADNTELYKGETAQLYGANLDGATFTSSDDTIATVDPETLVVSAVGGGEVTITATKGNKTAEVVLVIADEMQESVSLSKDATATANTQQDGSDEAENAVDGDSETVWHSAWSGFNVSADNPAILTVDLSEEMALTGFQYQNRPSGTNGIIQKFRYVVGTEYDAETNTITDGQVSDVITSTSQNPGAWMQVNFDGEKTVRYIQIIVEQGIGSFASIAEIQGLRTLKVTNEATLTDTEIKLGQTTVLVPETAEGTVVKGLVWTSSDPSIVSVTQSGVISGLNVGSATITITNAAGLKASCVVTVTEEKASVDTAALANAIAEAKALDLTKYENDANMKAFKDALAAAEAVLADPEAAQEQVDAAAAALKDAQSKLKEITIPNPNPDPDPTPNPGDPDQGGSLPSTGDNSNIVPIVILLVVCVAAVVGIVIWKKKSSSGPANTQEGNPENSTAQ